ncbi:MAG: hypothetical protein ACJA01_002440 [Saprospiraceae bacterium]|jgi:hypothetical protein
MKKWRFYLECLALLAVFMFTACGDDELELVSPGTLSISSLDDMYEAVRGTELDITYTANAQDGIAKVVTIVNDVSSEITPTGQSNYTGTVSFTIPSDAVLNDKYDIVIEVIDVEGDKQSASSSIVASALLTVPPSTYIFEREGATTVSFSGQNERLDQVEEIKEYLKLGDGGVLIAASVLSDAYSNANENGNDFFSFSSTKQLKNKSFQPDLDVGFMENLFLSAEEASKTGITAANGQAGLIVRENSGNTVLVSANGREYAQMIEKGLMGTVMYNQIFNTYFSDDRTGDGVENTALRDGKNNTDMEHHWDEAFGYWNPPLDFTSDWPPERASEDRFWSHYSNTVDPYLGTNDRLMQAFLAGRTAIVNNDLSTKTQKRSEVAENLELVAAGVAVHYINSTLAAINESKTGEAFHTLTEAWTFVNALKYNANRRMTLEQIEQINESDFGADGNFWNVTVEGLNKAKTSLVSVYNELESSKDEL